MALTSANADAAASAFCSAQSITDSAAIAHWKALFETIYAHLLTDLSVSVGENTIATAGGPANQLGPTPLAVPCIIA